MMNAFLISDDTDVSGLLSDFLTAQNCVVDACPGQDALKCIKKNQERRWGLFLSPLENVKLAEQAEAIRAVNPDAIVIAWADMDQKKQLDALLKAKVLSDFIPLPFSASDLEGILKLVKEE
jgi:DNA-binding NtrC family response regulator